MNTSCKPTVNRAAKMVPEGGFEPPTRGFSILLQPLKNNVSFVNHSENGANGINSLQSACKPNATAIADLTRARCVFQAMTVALILKGKL
jgi:hypothetical protein